MNIENTMQELTSLSEALVEKALQQTGMTTKVIRIQQEEPSHKVIWRTRAPVYPHTRVVYNAPGSHSSAHVHPFSFRADGNFAYLDDEGRTVIIELTLRCRDSFPGVSHHAAYSLDNPEAYEQLKNALLSFLLAVFDPLNDLNKGVVEAEELETKVAGPPNRQPAELTRRQRRTERSRLRRTTGKSRPKQSDE